MTTTGATEEMEALIKTLLGAKRRLEELTLGQVDSVTGSDGTTILLGGVQEQMRAGEARKQAAILNALPAHIALLDPQGNILSINEAWRRFGEENGLQMCGTALGANYLEVCDRACGEDLEKACEAARGIRSVLEGTAAEFSFEYPCHSSAEKRWFLMRVNPLQAAAPHSAVVMHINITGRKIAEELLRASETGMAAAQQIAHIGSWEQDLGTSGSSDIPALRWSEEMYRIAGYRSGAVQLNEDFFFSIVHPDDRDSVRLAVAKAIRERGKYSIAHRLIRPSGEIRRIQETGRVFFSPVTGEPLKIVGTALDITEQSLVEEALRASLEEFQTLAEAMPQIVWITDATGQHIYYNPQWSEYTGLSPEESRDHGWTKRIHPADLEKTEIAWRRALSCLEQFSMETRLRRADGIYRWWLVRGVPLLDASGAVYKWLGTCTDIEDLKQAHDKVVEQANLLDSCHEAIVVMDPDDRIVYWNKGAERIYGYASDEALGRTSLQLLYENSPNYLEAHAAVLTLGEWNGEIHCNGKNGVITADAHWSLVRDAGGNAKSILSINSDITEKKKLEGQYLRAQRMESIGTLAGGVAHDLNNVLAPIMMAVEILRDSIVSEDGHDLLNTLQQSAQRGAELVKQVLSFARGVEGRRVAINPIHLMRDLVNVMRDTFPKSIAVKFIPAPNIWSVAGDPTQMHQVFLNLCVNARDAMPLGGKLKVRMQNLILDETYAGMDPHAHPGAYLVITVEDTGTGIPRDVQDKIFEPFFTTKEIGKGTGLGLSTTLAIVKSHGGFINLYSEPGKGTTFKVYFPANTTSPSAEPVVEEIRLPRGCGELILLVDDEEPILEIVHRTLERFGYKVVTAANGAEAVAVYATHRDKIALVLTDMAMPVMDGAALIFALKSLNPLVKIIGSSGFSSKVGTIQALSLGIEQFLPKPYTAETILKALDEVLQVAAV